MKKAISIFFLFIICTKALLADVKVGVHKEVITPELSTPSAGYARRIAVPMEGIHDPLYATTAVIQNDEELIAICAVDHLGFDYSMCKEVEKRALEWLNQKNLTVYVCSSHTHAGGGGFLPIPEISKFISGKFLPAIRERYIKGAVDSIVSAYKNLAPAKIGFSSMKLKGLTLYRSKFPMGIEPKDQLFVISFLDLNDKPIGTIYNFAIHPTTLGAHNLQFSSDLIHYARETLAKEFGNEYVSLFINGAQAEILPNLTSNVDQWALCKSIGDRLGFAVSSLIEKTTHSTDVKIDKKRKGYHFTVAPTNPMMKMPSWQYISEINYLVFDDQYGCITAPGELSCCYEYELESYAKNQGIKTFCVFGLTNDAHGYILKPEAIENKTQESFLSFGDKNYGEVFKEMCQELIDTSK